MIETYLKDQGLLYATDADGDFQVKFAFDEELGCSLEIWLLVGGSENQIYAVRVLSDKQIAKDDWGKAVVLCNQWNKEHRWPKAYLFVADENTDAFGVINLEENINLSAGVHQQLLEDWTNTVRASAVEFWRWVHQDQPV